jgi:hypothetical protein
MPLCENAFFRTPPSAISSSFEHQVDSKTPIYIQNPSHHRRQGAIDVLKFDIARVLV